MLPPGLDVPASATLVAPQTKFAVWLAALSVGATKFDVIFTVAADVDVQPLLVLVTDNEYTEAALTFTLLLLAEPTMVPPLQVYVVAPPGPPVIFTVGVVHVITGVVFITAVGFTVLVFTAMALLLVQPLVVLVTLIV